MRKKSKMNDYKCRAVKPDGTPCSAKAQESKNWCYFHDPGQAEERRAAQARGGQGNRAPSLPIDAPDFAPETVSDVASLFVATINQVRRRELTPNAGTTICNLGNGLMKALGDRDLQQRLRRLEQLLSESKVKEGLFDPDVE
jgi:hypothetical protein